MVATTQTTPGALVFLPKPSNGGKHMAVLAGIILALPLMTLLPLIIVFALLPGTSLLTTLGSLWFIFLPLFIFDVLMTLWIARYAFYFPQMRYEIAPDGLHLRYGPLLHYHIPYDSIRKVWVHNFPQRPYVRRVSSPGIQLYGALYHDMGKVMMCATARQGPILLIKTDRETYGITPQDEEGFIETLRSYTGESAEYGPLERTRDTGRA